MLVVPVKGRTRSESGCERTLQSEKVQRVLCSYASCVGWLARGPWLQHRHRRNERDDHQCTNLDRKSSQKSLWKGSQRPQGERKTSPKHSKIALGRLLDDLGHLGGVSGRSGDAPGTPRDSLGTPRGAPGMLPGRPRDSQGGPRSVQWATRECPRCVGSSHVCINA